MRRLSNLQNALVGPNVRESVISFQVLCLLHPGQAQGLLRVGSALVVQLGVYHRIYDIDT